MACGGGEEETPAASTPAVNFTANQAASIVMGQTSMTANTNAISETEMNVPSTAFVTAGGAVVVAERNNSRVIIFNATPTANGAAADSVLGHAAFTDPSTGTSATELYNPRAAVVYGTQTFVSDFNNHRVVIYNSNATNSAAAIAIGQVSPSVGLDPNAGGGIGTTATTLRFPDGIAVAAGKMVIADSAFNRVLLYDSIPTSSGAAASFVLGQANLTSNTQSAATMKGPGGVWTDGTKIAVCEPNGHRCRLWNSWPTSNGQVANILIGQPDLTTTTSNQGGISAHSLNSPHGVASNGTELAIADSMNNRVLYWKTWPTTSNQDADLVFGQADFTTATSGLSETKFNGVEGVSFSGSNLFVTDTSNHRVLIFKKQ